MICPHELSVASYALGTLDPADRAEVAAHLPSCGRCGSRLQELGALPGLLARVPADVAEAGLPRPDVRVLDRALTSAAVETGHRRRRLLAVAAAVLVVVGAGTAAVGWRDAAPRASTVAGERGPVSARVELTPAGDGTDLALHLAGVAPAQVCRLVAVGHDGRREVAATWQVNYTGEVAITGRTGMPADRIGRLVVETDDDRALVELAVPG